MCVGGGGGVPSVGRSTVRYTCLVYEGRIIHVFILLTGTRVKCLFNIWSSESVNDSLKLCQYPNHKLQSTGVP